MAKHVENHELREGWRDLVHPWERLRWARTYWAFQNDLPRSAEYAAGAVGMKGGTYRAYERPPTDSKHTSLDHQMAIRFARKFKVNWTWLLLNHGTPFDEPQNEIQSRVVRTMSQFNEAEQEAIALMLETFMSSGKRANG